MIFPDVYSSDFKANDFKLAKEAIDFAVSNYNNTSFIRSKLQKIYDSYNGIIDPKRHESLTKPFGIQSKTEYKHYNFGLNKVKILVGEFLSTNIDPRVETADEEQLNAKFEKFLERKAMIALKEPIMEARQNGYDVFPGVAEEMEDEEKFLSPKNFKTENERLLTKYLIRKVKADRLKLKLKQNLIDAVNTSMIFGKVETVNGVDSYRRISPLNALYMDIDTEGFMEESPYVGEKRRLYYHQILKEFDLSESKDKKKIERIKELASMETSTDMNAATNPTLNSGSLIDVYTIEFKTFNSVSYFKISPNPEATIREIPEDDYNKNRKKYEADVKKGRYEIQRVVREEVWEISRIGTDIYERIRPVERQVSQTENRKLRAKYNYILLMMDMVEGVRIPIQYVISKLDETYNDTMFLINRELRKPSGNALGLNVGFLPKKTPYDKIMTELVDDGTIRYNTSAEGNAYNMDGRSGDNAINSVNMGDKGRVIDTLIRLKTDVEYSIDRITGINRSRTGQEMATTTATTANNNLETSRTTTYDIFFNMKEFSDEVMTRLVEKGKMNFVENNPDLFGGIFSEEEFSFITATRDIALENFVAYINDGRKELLVREKIEALFPQDINSGNLRSKDVAKFHLQDTLANALKVLDNAWEEIQKVAQQTNESNNQAAMQQKEADRQMMQEDREDRQQHEIDKIVKKGEIDLQIKRSEGETEIQDRLISDGTKRQIAREKNISNERNKSVKNGNNKENLKGK